MAEKTVNLWIRWIVAFTLLSLGAALIDGLDQAMHDQQPLPAFIGYWISQAIFIVFPGAIVGGVIAAVTNRSSLGVKVMIAINSIVVALLVFGAVLQVQG